MGQDRSFGWAILRVVRLKKRHLIRTRRSHERVEQHVLGGHFICSNINTCGHILSPHATRLFGYVEK